MCERSGIRMELAMRNRILAEGQTMVKVEINEALGRR